jgi:hypothetical protein
MSNILKKPGWNSVIEEKAGRKYTKTLNSAISDLVERSSLGSNPAQKIQRIANALHKHYADKSFSNKEIIEYIKSELPSIKLRSDNDAFSQETLYTADNQWNSQYIPPQESENNITQPNDVDVVQSSSTEDYPLVVAKENVRPSKTKQDLMLKEEYYKRMRHFYRMEELFR